MIVVERLPDPRHLSGSIADFVVLTWEERERSRQRLRTSGGREIALKLPTGTRLPPGTVLFAGEGFHIEVVAAEEDVWVARVDDPATLARVAYEIGNRHFAVDIRPGAITVRYDHTLEELWHRLGIEAERTRQPFLAEQRPPHRHG